MNRKGKAMLTISCLLLILGFVGLVGTGYNTGVNDQRRQLEELRARNQQLFAWKEFYRKGLAAVPQLWMLVKRTGEEVPDNGSEVRNAIQLAASRADDETNHGPPHLE